MKNTMKERKIGAPNSDRKSRSIPFEAWSGIRVSETTAPPIQFQDLAGRAAGGVSLIQWRITMVAPHMTGRDLLSIVDYRQTVRM